MTRPFAGARSWAIVAALLPLALGPGAIGAQAAHPLSASQARRAVNFWTPARMARARPVDRLRAGSPSVATGSAATTSADVYASSSSSPTAGASSAAEAVPDPTVAGARTNGVVFLVTGFGLGRCSGTSVKAPNRSVVVTAGHCLDDPFEGLFAARVVFVPGYRYGQRPFGVFAARWIDTTRQWHFTHNGNYDVGAFVVGRNEHGQRLGKAVGGVDIAWNLKRRQVFDVHGYSVDPPFDGETQQLCAQTPYVGHDPRSFFSPGPLNLGVECEVTSGASGGGWTIRGHILNGVTSYGYEGDLSTDFGPYFGREVGRLYRRARRVR